MNQVKKLFFGYYGILGNIDKSALKNRTLILAMGSMAFVVQLAMVFVYAVLLCPPMILFAALGALSAAVCCLMTFKGHYNLAGILMTGGILLVAVTDDFFVGSSNNLMLYLITALAITL